MLRKVCHVSYGMRGETGEDQVFHEGLLFLKFVSNSSEPWAAVDLLTPRALVVRNIPREPACLFCSNHRQLYVLGAAHHENEACVCFKVVTFDKAKLSKMLPYQGRLGMLTPQLLAAARAPVTAAAAAARVK